MKLTGKIQFSDQCQSASLSWQAGLSKAPLITLFNMELLIASSHARNNRNTAQPFQLEADRWGFRLISGS